MLTFTCTHGTTEPWLTVSLRNAAVCQHTALLLCQTARGADHGDAALVLHALGSSTWGHVMSKGTSEPWAVGGDTLWPYIVPCCIVDIRSTAKGPGLPRQPLMGWLGVGERWLGGPRCKWWKASWFANKPWALHRV